jgi:hypothetical protein
MNCLPLRFPNFPEASGGGLVGEALIRPAAPPVNVRSESKGRNHGAGTPGLVFPSGSTYALLAAP